MAFSVLPGTVAYVLVIIHYNYRALVAKSRRMPPNAQDFGTDNGHEVSPLSRHRDA